MSESKLSPEEKKVLRKISKEKKDNVIYTSFLETDDYILEQVNNTTHTTLPTQPTHTTYCVFNKKTRLIDYQDNFIYQGREYCPIVDELLLNNTILLAGKAEEYGNDNKLVKEITDFLYSYFEVPQFFENFLPFLVMFYWVYQKFPFVPYLHFVGLTGTGKTTAQEVLGSVCYKSIDASGAITLSPIFRTASTWHGTLLLDEFEPDGEGYKEMLSFLKSGVGNKAVLRTEGDKKREVRVYLIKAPKIFTSEKPISNAGLQSRTIVIQMKKSKRDIPLYRLPHFLDESQSLRNKLLMWRLNNLNNIDLTKIEFGFNELKMFDRRVQQVITPIYYLSDDKTKKKIVEFAKVQQEETLKERRDSLEGQIFQALLDNISNPVLKIITEIVNKDRPKNRPFTERKIANIVRKVFGFEIERLGSENISTVILEKQDEKIKELADYFGCVVSVGSVGAVVSVVDDSLGLGDW